MFLYDSVVFYIVSLFHSKFRQWALISLELTNSLVILVLSIALFDHLLKDAHNNYDIINNQPTAVHDNFSDLIAYLNTPRTNNDSEFPIFESVIIPYVLNESDNPTLAEVMGIELRNDATSFQKFQLTFRKQEMYRDDDPMIDELLHDLATWPIESVETFRGGTQIKMYINFTNNAGRAVMKPMKCSREQETLPNRYMFRDLERHNAEIAAFHLDRALGFRRTAPVVGRKINITSEILEICDNDLKETFFLSPDDKKCFHGYNCSQYCNVMHPICGNPEIIEVAMMAYMPFFNKSDERHFQNPWRRAYHVRKKAEWTKDNEWCDYVRLEETYYPGTRRILDVIDMHVLDFLITNQDRHHYETLAAFGAAANSTASIIHLDHGRSFGRAFWDDHVILTPIRQCCTIRNTTLATLLRYHNGPVKLSEHMRKSMANDPVAPVLWEPHYHALDRRVGLILQEIRICIEKTIPAKRLKYESDDPPIDRYAFKPGDSEKDTETKEKKIEAEPKNSKSVTVIGSDEEKATKVHKKLMPIDKNKEIEMDKELQVNVVENKDQDGIINPSDYDSDTQSN